MTTDEEIQTLHRKLQMASPFNPSDPMDGSGPVHHKDKLMEKWEARLKELTGTTGQPSAPHGHGLQTTIVE